LNANIPEVTYLHIVRTGRAGANGEIRYSADETDVFLRDIERIDWYEYLLAEKYRWFQPDPNASTAPIQAGQGRQQRNLAQGQKSRNFSEVLIWFLAQDAQVLTTTEKIKIIFSKEQKILSVVILSCYTFILITG
jgi:hypothetical protein